MQGSTLIGNQVIQVRQAGEKRRLTPTWMVEVFHHEQLPVDGVVGLIQQRAAGWHLGVGEHRIPPRLFVLEPVTHTRTVLWSQRAGDVIGEVAESLAHRHDP